MEEKKINFIRVAMLRLMLTDSDALQAMQHIEEGRVDLAKQVLLRVIDHIKKTQKDIAASMKESSNV